MKTTINPFLIKRVSENLIILRRENYLTRRGTRTFIMSNFVRINNRCISVSWFV